MKQAASLYVAAGAVLTAAPAMAAEEGLPQFNTALFPEQLFWLAISFSALYLLMRFVALPGVESAQTKRKAFIEGELAVAKKANEEAKAMAVNADKALAEARAKANATIADIKTEASKLAGEQQATQAKQLATRLREAEAAIAATRDAALKEIEKSAADLAAAIVENVSKVRA